MRYTEVDPLGKQSKSRPTTLRNDFARTTIAPVRRKTMAEGEKLEFFRNLGSVNQAKNVLPNHPLNQASKLLDTGVLKPFVNS
jgi:hypothetical protein